MLYYRNIHKYSPRIDSKEISKNSKTLLVKGRQGRDKDQDLR